MQPDDLYTWTVTLDDETQLREVDLGGMAPVPLDRVRRLDVYCPEREPDRPLFTVHLGPHQTLIWFRDRRIALDSTQLQLAEDGDVIGGPRRTASTVFGWKTTTNGKTVKTYVWLQEDGSILLTDYDYRFEPPPAEAGGTRRTSHG